MPYSITVTGDNGPEIFTAGGKVVPGNVTFTPAPSEIVSGEGDKNIYFGTAVKALDDNGRVGGYLVSWGDRQDRDLQNEWFTAKTDFRLNWYDKRPALYQHGLDSTLKAEEIGVIDVIREDEAGIWAEAQLDLRNQYVQKVLTLVKQGAMSWSSGSLSHLVQVDRGQIKFWPIVEGSLTPTPADPRDTARIHSLKSLLDIAAKGHDDKAPPDDDQTTDDEHPLSEPTESNLMTKEQILEFALKLAQALGIEDEDVTNQVVDDVVEAHPEPEEAITDVDVAEASVKAIVDDIETRFKAVLAEDAKRKTAKSYLDARIAANQAAAETESKVPETVKATPEPQIEVSTKYARLSAEDMSFLADIGQAVHGFKPTEQFTRELADKAQKSLKAQEIDLPDASVKAISIAADMGAKIKSDEVMYSTLTSYGDEWVPELWSDQLWNKARLDNVVLPLVRVVEMPSDPFKMPIESGDPTVYYVPETQDEAQLTFGTGNPIPDSQMGTANVTLDASKFGLRVTFSTELIEDSIIGIIPQLRSQSTRAMMDAVDNVILNADDTASGNINKDGGTPAATDKHMAFSYGMRHTALVDNSGNNDLSAANQRVTARLIRETRGLLPDRYAARPRDIAYITNFSVYSTLLGMDEVQTVDKFGSFATILSGEIPMFDGSPILVSAEHSNTATNGKISSTGANNVYGSLLAVYLPGWVVGYRRRVTTRMEPVPGVDAYSMLMTLRMALTRFDVYTASALFYLDI